MLEQDLIKSVFACSNLRVFAPTEQDIYLANASLEEIKEYLPSDIDLTKNPDLLGVAFNGCVINWANKNGDIIGTDDAIAMVPSFKGKFINFSHSRATILGFITDYGFSEFRTNKPMSEKEAKKTKEPFNIVLSGYVWKLANPAFAQILIDSADPESENYGKISTSWEIGFRNWGIVKGSKNLAECTEIEDEADFDKYKKYLKAFGGKGFSEDDEPVYRVIKSADGVPPLGLGFGFTENPAADVKGVLVSQAEENKEKSSGEENINNLEEKSSQNKKESVKDSINIMKKNIRFKSTEEITDEILVEASADSVRDFISEKLAESSKQWEEEKSAKDKEIAAANAKAEEANKLVESVKAESEKMKNDFDALKKELDQIKADNEAREQNARFQARMVALDNEYNLEDEERAIIVADIKDLDDEAFAGWLKKFEVFAKAKKKEVQAKAKEENKSGEAKASEEEKEKLLQAAEAEKNKLPNTLTPENKEPSIRERMSKAFSIEGFEISTRK